MTLHTKQLGKGPDLVLIHGWALSLEVWEPITELLVRDFRLTLVDLPGHGNSPMDGEFTVDSVVQKLVSVIPQDATVLGWSLGGLMVMALAALHPKQVHKLILLASNPCFVSTPDRPLGMAPDVLDQFGQALMKNYRETVAKFLAAATLGATDGPALLRHLLQQMDKAPRPDTKVLQDGLSILRNTDLRTQLKNVSCPTLILLGERDTLVPAAVGDELLEALPNSQLKIISGAGHAPFISHPKQFVRVIRDFAA